MQEEINKLTDDKLDDLVESGTISSYEYTDRKEFPDSTSRNIERLVIIFPNGNKLELETFCVGRSENTSIMIKQ